MQQVINYYVAWNVVNHTGVVSFHVAGVAAPHVLNFNNAAEFNAVAHLMEKYPLGYDPANGQFSTQPRPVGT